MVDLIGVRGLRQEISGSSIKAEQPSSGIRHHSHQQHQKVLLLAEELIGIIDTKKKVPKIDTKQKSTSTSVVS